MKHILYNDKFEVVGGKQYLEGVGGYDGTNPDEFNDIASVISNISKDIDDIKQLNVVEITYDELKSLRDNSKLVTGEYYRITDYVTTTIQNNTQSAEKLFDVIVLALNENTLSEEAYAINSERDDIRYFGNSNLSAWKLWYCLDNDPSRFGWADESNGKGVIYRMIDEFGNDCPYDFKNIQFKRDTSYSSEGVKISNGGDDYVYTFCFVGYSYNDIMADSDGTTSSDYENIELGDMEDGSLYPKVHHNVMKPCHSVVVDDELYRVPNILYLNDNVISSCWEFNTDDGGCYNNTLGFNCCNNSFDSNCHSNTFGNDCCNNTFGTNCSFNTFGNDCDSNTFGDNCHNITFDDGCNSNTFGYCCYSISFGNECSSNTFGDNCATNTFGNSCYDNTFSIECSSITLGNSCVSNTFGDSCYSITLGNNCSYITFGNECYNNTFGNVCFEISFGGNCSGNTFGNYCSHNSFSDSYSGNHVLISDITSSGDITAVDINATNITASGISSKGTINSDSNIASKGNITATGTMTSAGFYQSSDERLKTFTSDYDISLDDIKNIKTGKFYWNSDESQTINGGVSAQTVEEYFPELVKEDGAGMKSVNYDGLAVVAIAAIKKLTERIEQLEEIVRNK